MNIKAIRVLQLKSLRTKDILNFVRIRSDIFNYLPDYDYSKHPNREFLCSMGRPGVFMKLFSYYSSAWGV